METEKLGDLFIDGKLVNLDSAQVDQIDRVLEILIKNRSQKIEKVNEILTDFQK